LVKEICRKENTDPGKSVPDAMTALVDKIKKIYDIVDFFG